MVTWCPKATVQAALAGVAYDYVQAHPEYAYLLPDAELLLTTGVLSIVMTAPAFAVAMYYAGRAWLEQDEADATEAGEPQEQPQQQPSIRTARHTMSGAYRRYPNAGTANTYSTPPSIKMEFELEVDVR